MNYAYVPSEDDLTRGQESGSVRTGHHQGDPRMQYLTR